MLFLEESIQVEVHSS